MTSNEGLSLFDAAHTVGDPVLIPVRLDIAALRAQAGSGSVPPLLRGLVRGPARRTVEAGMLSSSLAQRLAKLPESERYQTVLDLVCARAAAVLGHATAGAVEADRPFSEIGFDSMTALELRNRLQETVGQRLPVTILFDHPTPAELAKYLLSELDVAGTGAVRDSPEIGPGIDEEPLGPLASLYWSACQLGKYDEATELLAVVSQLRPTFDASSAAEHAPEPVWFARGDGSPQLICFPSFSTVAGPHEYTRFAEYFRGLRDVTILPHPGFTDEGSLPASLSVLAEMHAETVRRHTEDGKPFVLVGRSLSGWLAHAVAVHLESAGIHPAAVALVDSYDDSEVVMDEVGPLARKHMLERENKFALLAENRLSAMGAYNRIIGADWKPLATRAPILLLRATEPFSPEVREVYDDSYWLASWDLAHSTLDIPGNHFTVLEEHSETTAQAVDTWLKTMFQKER